jgi:formate dehydrogenase beta subunit
MGIHEWSYDNDVSLDTALQGSACAEGRDAAQRQGRSRARLRSSSASQEAQRCLNCDIETVFEDNLCIECDACVDICPMDCITFTPNDPKPALRTHLTAPAPNLTQDLYVSDDLLKTGA